MLPKYLAEAIQDEYLISTRLRAVLEDTTYSVDPVMENDFIPGQEEEAHEDVESNDENDFDSGDSGDEGFNYTGIGLVAQAIRLWFHRKYKMCH